MMTRTIVLMLIALSSACGNETDNNTNDTTTDSTNTAAKAQQAMDLLFDNRVAEAAGVVREESGPCPGGGKYVIVDDDKDPQGLSVGDTFTVTETDCVYGEQTFNGRKFFEVVEDHR